MTAYFKVTCWQKCVGSIHSVLQLVTLPPDPTGFDTGLTIPAFSCPSFEGFVLSVSNLYVMRLDELVVCLTVNRRLYGSYRLGQFDLQSIVADHLVKGCLVS